MTHRALVERNYALPEYLGSGVELSPLGGPASADWQTLHSALPVFLITRSGREVAAPDKIVVVDSIRMLVPRFTDISTRDRVNGVEDRLGTSIVAGKMNIRSVLPHHDHIECELEKAS